MKPIFLLLTSLSLQAWAGNKVGNGGDVVICGDKHTILDLQDMKDKKIALDKFEKDETYVSILKNRFKLMSEKKIYLGEQYKRRLESIVKEIDINPDIDLIDVKDSKHISLPKGCKLQQIAVRKEFVNGDEKRFLIVKQSWKKLDHIGRAALILHEIVFEHFTRLGEQDSRKVRAFVGHILAQSFADEEAGAFWLFIKTLEIPLYPSATQS